MKWQACPACSYRFPFEVIAKLMKRRNKASCSGARRNGMCPSCMSGINELSLQKKSQIELKALNGASQRCKICALMQINKKSLKVIIPLKREVRLVLQLLPSSMILELQSKLSSTREIFLFDLEKTSLITDMIIYSVCSFQFFQRNYICGWLSCT